MADEDEDATGASTSTDERLARLEGGLAALAAQRTPTSHSEAQRNTERRLDRGSDLEARVEEEVSKILHGREEAAKRKALDDTTGKRLDALEKSAKSSSSSERPPAERQIRGITRFMWGGN